MLTKQDETKIETIVETIVDKKLDEKFENKWLPRIEAMMNLNLEEKLEQKFNEKLSHLPTKDEFFKAMDKIMGELKTIREEQSMITYRLSNHETRITTIEQTVSL